MSVASDFRDYIADLITSGIAQNENCADFIIRPDDEDIVYVEVEAGEVWLIQIREADVVTRASRREADG